MTLIERAAVTEGEYLDLERRSATKHELIHGVVLAMAGASPRHNAIAANVIGLLRAAVRGGPCTVLTSDQRVHVPATGLYTYPDVTVVCGTPELHPRSPDTLVNPTVLVEVLSASTEEYDRGAKFAHFRAIASLAEVLFVDEVDEKVEHYRRLETGQWLLTEYEGDGVAVALPALGCELPMGEIYEGAERFPVQPAV